MCVVCGCNDASNPRSHAPHEHHHHDHPSHVHAHEHAHGHPHAPVHERTPGSLDLHFGQGAARVSVPGMSQARAIQIEQDVLGYNNQLARANRAHFAAHGVLAVNLVSSPGAGKTTLLCATLAALQKARPELDLCVIEGDQQTSHDAERVRALAVPAVQVNTGKGCHLDAEMVAQAFSRLPAHAASHSAGHSPRGVLFIENVGNLVCPALWDLGERAKVALLSVTEGEDKPLKYPDMFAAADLLLLNKVDLLPYVHFDVERCLEYARRVNPRLATLQVSATRGDGLESFLAWIEAQRAAP